MADWCVLNLGIVRGLAYYTGMVFEVHEATGAERAIAGGGRYEGLIELMGGPSTPAVGFAMGDVVLELVLRDRGLMPEGVELADAIGTRPDAVVIGNGSDEMQAMVPGVLGLLRDEGVHARRSYKTTRNVGKLVKEAQGQGARFVVVLESAEWAVVRDLDAPATGGGPAAEPARVRLEELADWLLEH